ncbi:MAG TPA: hypothetical protein VH277_03520 [Gemmatimonadaceae bacterium]|jgi:hypothetical protein|nr:hypothetical protein [Gemmatimonadaceae bacterium]
MNHRHLLPDEIDLLLADDEVGFGVSPLKAHIRDCPDCRLKVEEERFVVDVLEDLPHLAPSHDFASKVMLQVPVFVPWHVTARESIARYIPRSRSARVAVGALATSAASVITIAILWIATQTDALVVASTAAGDQMRGLVYDAGRLILTTVFGDQIFSVVQRTGSVGVAAAVLGLAAATGASIAGLSALASASSRRRA